MLTSVNWIRISLINLCLVATLGVLMRYKIAFEFPFLDQKNIQHAHSHFAFYGWITHTLLFLLVDYLQKKSIELVSQKYTTLIIINLISAYGMLITFSIGGYNAYSILFSLIAIVVSYLFTIWFITDLRKLNWTNTSMYWFGAALIFNVIASLGTFFLGYMMATKHLTQHLYLASVYFYLHFQYNGWFFFATMGLLSLFLGTNLSSFKNDKRVFWMFALSCIPAYFLSTLWMKLPMWLYVLVVIAACVQFLAWILFLRHIKRYYVEIKSSMSKLLFYFLMLTSISLTIKFGLQLASVIPRVSTLAFGFRPIVIAYLHLVLLAIISIFLISYFLSNQLIKLNRVSQGGTILLTVGVYATELILAIQGIASFTYTLIPYANEALLLMALVMLTGILLLAFSFRKQI
jgi:hypothetical protein